VQNGVHSFSNAAPDAAGLSIHHANETNSRHSAYRSGVSAWCGNCHGDFHDATGTFVHASGSAVGGAIAALYNAYNGTADPAGGSQATAYLAAVPFEDPSATTTATGGPSASSTVMCLSCHRAHASSAPDAGRWDFKITFLDDDGVESGSYAIPNPYSNSSQRSLCNKCHVKDEGDALS
jgi:hypothetical protein